MVSALMCMATHWIRLIVSHDIRLLVSHDFTKLLHISTLNLEKILGLC